MNISFLFFFDVQPHASIIERASNSFTLSMARVFNLHLEPLMLQYLLDTRALLRFIAE